MAKQAGAAAGNAAAKAGAVANDAAVQLGSAAKAMKDVVVKATGTAEQVNQLGTAAGNAAAKVGSAVESLGTAASKAGAAASKSAEACSASFGSIWSDLWNGALGKAGADSLDTISNCSQSVATALKSLLAFFI